MNSNQPLNNFWYYLPQRKAIETALGAWAKLDPGKGVTYASELRGRKAFENCFVSVENHPQYVPLDIREMAEHLGYIEIRLSDVYARLRWQREADLEI